MSDRVPHALNWLVRRRRIINGHLEKALRDKSDLQQDLGTRIRHLDLQIRALRKDLKGLDSTIRMHDIQIDPRRTGSTRPQLQPRRTPYGEMTGVLLKALAGVFPDCLSTYELTAIVRDACEFTPVVPSDEELIYKVRKRLGNLHSDGKVTRLHAARIGSKELGRWCLPAPPPGWGPAESSSSSQEEASE